MERFSFAHREALQKFGTWRAVAALGVALPLAASYANAQNTAPAKKMNVLFIAVDDLNTTLGTYGHPVVKTPNIDRLASWGVRFDRAFCQMPWCNPSRASLLSGLRPDTTRIVDLETPVPTHIPGAILLPQHFKQNGYFSARVGKIYHESGNAAIKNFANDAASWDVSVQGQGTLTQGELKKRERFRKFVNVRGSSRERGLEWAALDVRDEETGDGQVARQIAALMEPDARGAMGKDAGGRSKPWFLAAGFRKPHLVWEAPTKYFDLYDAAKIPLPQEPPLAAQNIPLPARGWNPGKPPISDTDWREALRGYYASISFMDAQVGVLLDQVDKLRLRDSTVIVLFSDHGYALGEHGGQWEKVKLFDKVLRTPLLIAAPGLSPGKASPRTVELLDIYPTLVELCGLPDPGARSPWKLQGQSLAPLLRDPNAPRDRPAYSVLGNPQTDIITARSVRTERWRYMEYGPDARLLYDHDNDPHEYRNLADDPKFAAVAAQMKALLLRAKQEHQQQPVPLPVTTR